MLKKLPQNIYFHSFSFENFSYFCNIKKIINQQIMKLRLTLILPFFAIVANAQDVVQSVNFSYLNEKVSITYNFNVSEKGESFFVWVEAKTAKEKPLEMKTLSGNIGEVTAEGSK